MEFKHKHYASPASGSTELIESGKFSFREVLYAISNSLVFTKLFIGRQVSPAPTKIVMNYG